MAPVQDPVLLVDFPVRCIGFERPYLFTYSRAYASVRFLFLRLLKVGQAAVACLDDFQAGNWEMASFLGDGKKIKKQAHHLSLGFHRWIRCRKWVTRHSPQLLESQTMSDPIYIFFVLFGNLGDDLHGQVTSTWILVIYIHVSTNWLAKGI